MSFLDKIKNSFTDNTGWFRNKRFTPLQQLQDVNTSRIPAVNNSFQNQNMSLNGLPQQKLVLNQPQQQTQLPTLEPPKPVFKTDAADRLSSRLDAIKKFGTSDPAKIAGESAVKQEDKNFWDTGLGTGLVKAQEFTKPMADNMEQSIKTYKEDPTKIITEGVPKLAKGIFVDTPKAMGRWAWNTGEILAGKKQQELDKINREQDLKNKVIWNKLEVAKRYRESGNIEMANKILEEVKALNNGNTGQVYDDLIAKNEVDKNQYLADAVTTGMTVAGAGQPLNPKNLLTGGAISGTIGLVSGKDPFEATGQGIANAQKVKAITQFTNPVITKTINTFIKPESAPFLAEVITKVTAGTGNILEDRLIDKLEMKDRTIMDDFASFVLGAVIGNADAKVGKWKTSDFDPATIKKQLAEDLLNSGKIDPDDVKALNMLVDRITNIGTNNMDSMRGSINLGADVSLKPDAEVKKDSDLKAKIEASPEKVPAFIQALKDRGYGEKEIASRLKNLGVDTTNLNFKNEPTAISSILSDRKTEIGKSGDITGLGAEDSRPLPPKPKPFVDYKKQDTEILKSLAKQETPDTGKSDFNAKLVKQDVKTEPEMSKVTTPPEIVNPKPSGEVVEPKIEEILSPQEQKVRAENEIMMERFRNGEFSKETHNKINTIFDGQETKLKYKDANIDKIKDVRLRAQIKNAMSFDQWVDDNSIKNADAKSNEKWLQVKKIENEIAPKKSKPIKEVLTKPVVASEQEKAYQDYEESKLEEIRADQQTKLLEGEAEKVKLDEQQKRINKPVVETKPVVEPKTKPEPKVEEPKRTAKPLPPETKHYSKEVVDKVVDFETRVVKIGELAQKEGVSLAPDNIKRVLNGEVKVSPELKTQIEGIQTELRQGEIEIGNEGALKAEPHISDVDIRRTDTELTSKETFENLVLGSTFNASKKNTGSVPNEYKADWVDASIAENRYITRTKNESDILAGKIVEENNIPKEKIEDVKKIVETQKTVLEESNKTAQKSYKKGKQSKIDYLKIEADKENSLNALSGSKKTRPIWKADDNKSGNIGTKKISLDDQFRTEATFFRDKTPPEVYDALVELRLAEKGTGEMNYATALRNFYNVATKYDYESGTTREGVNHYINRRISTNKIIQSNVDKAIRAMSRQLSRSQIQHNIKVAVEQPFEVLRLAADNGYGIKKMAKAIKDSFNPTEAKRIIGEYGLEAEKSGNVPIKEVLAKQEQTDDGKVKQLWKKVVDASDNIGYKGVAMTENWKNIVFAKAAENAGIEKGLKGNELKKFVEKELIRIAHISDAGMTPRIMESAKGAGLLQYQQYSSKQNILLWNTLSGDLSLGKKAGQTIKYLMADYTAKATLAAVTGVKAVDFGKWVYEMVKPKLGPLLTIPYQMAENQYNYMKLDDEEKEKTPNPLTGSSADTLKVALTPGGVQIIAKTGKVSDILKDNYQLSKKGNVNYVAGDMSTFDKARALMFGAGAIPNKKEADKRWANLKKDGIYPTLTAEQSEVLKSLPKDEQEAYYNDKMAEQVSAKEIVDAEEKPKKKGIMGIFGRKEEEVPKKTVSDILSSDTATQKEKSKAKSIIKEKLDSGRLDSTNTSDNDLRAYFFSEVDEMPENDEIEKHEKTVEKWKKINSVIESDTLDKDTKDRIIKISGESKEDIDYYKKASMDNASRQRVLATLASQEDREKVIESLILSKKAVGGKAIAGSSEIEYLYDQGYISKEEKNFINSYKFDEIAGKFYQDRDYKNKMSGDASASLAKSQKEYAALLEKLRNIDENTASSTTKLSKSINDILGSEQKKPTSSLSKILRSKNIGGNKTTQFTNNLGKLKRVKAQYYY